MPCRLATSLYCRLFRLSWLVFMATTSANVSRSSGGTGGSRTHARLSPPVSFQDCSLMTTWVLFRVVAPGRNVAAFRPGTSRLFRAVNRRKGGAFIMALEPVTGIGPAQPAWKAGVLPLNYTDGWCREQMLLAPGGLLVCSEPSRSEFHSARLWATPRGATRRTRTADLLVTNQ